MLDTPRLLVRHRGVDWTMEPLTVAGTWLTVQVMDRSFSMPSSVLEFSLWDATCKQIPDMVLDDVAVRQLRPWLIAKGCPWRLGWKRQRPKPKLPEEDPRQLKLFK